MRVFRYFGAEVKNIWSMRHSFVSLQFTLRNQSTRSRLLKKIFESHILKTNNPQEYTDTQRRLFSTRVRRRGGSIAAARKETL